jgi:hypothetical protein
VAPHPVWLADELSKEPSSEGLTMPGAVSRDWPRRAFGVRTEGFQ